MQIESQNDGMHSTSVASPAGVIRPELRDGNSHGSSLEQPGWGGLSQVTWIRIGILSLLLVALFWPNLRRLWFKTNPISGETNWGHAFFVPLVSLYYLYVHREALLSAPVQPLMPRLPDRHRLISVGSLLALGAGFLWVLPLIAASQAANFMSAGSGMLLWAVFVLGLDWGLGTLLFGLFLFGYGIWPGQNDYLKDLSMVVTVFGLVAFLAGWRVMRTAWFSILFLICAFPWPPLVYSWVAWPLQRLAAAVAVRLLTVASVSALNDGSLIYIGSGPNMRTLNVAEACAGLRSLMTFIAVAAAVAFLSGRSLWQKILITLSAIPIAIFCNVLRVSGQGFLDIWDPRWSEGFAHSFAGLVMLVPAFFLILAVCWIVDRMVIEEVDLARLPQSRAAAKTKQADVIVVRPAARTAPKAATEKSAARPATAPPAAPAAQAGPATPAPRPAAAAPRPAAPRPASRPQSQSQGESQDLAEATRRMMAARAGSHPTAPKPPVRRPPAPPAKEQS